METKPYIINQIFLIFIYYGKFLLCYIHRIGRFDLEVYSISMLESLQLYFSLQPQRG